MILSPKEPMRPDMPKTNPVQTTLRRRAVVTALLGLTAVLPLASAHAQTPSESVRMTERSVTVSATGSTSATPDMAYISTGVMTEATTAREAMNLNNAAMSKLIDGLKKLGIDTKDIQTTSVNINPRYTNPRDGKAPIINGYQSHNSIRIAVRNVAKLGDILDAAITLGANQMGGIAFEVSNAEQLKR